MKFLKKLYDWVLSWADSPHGEWALFSLAFTESSFFPIPPDVLLIALVLGRLKKWARLALICLVGSVLGGIFGYLIGWQIWNWVSEFFFTYVFSKQIFEKVSEIYQAYDFLAIFTAGFTPIPYKVFTIAAGVCHINFLTFLVASILSRGARFFLVATLLRFFGSPIKEFIEKYFNLLTIVFIILLIAGFWVIKYVWLR